MIIGLVNGAVYEYSVADDMNSISEIRHYNFHTSCVTAVHYAKEAELILSCSKDKSVMWLSSKTSNRLGTP